MIVGDGGTLLENVPFNRESAIDETYARYLGTFIVYWV